MSDRTKFARAILDSLSIIKELPSSQRAVTAMALVGLAVTSAISIMGVGAGVGWGGTGVVWGWMLATGSLVVGVSGLFLSFRFVENKLPDVDTLVTGHMKTGKMGEPVFSRVILSLPLSEECQKKVHSRLVALRNGVRLHLIDQKCEHGPLRASVFLPDASRADTDQIFQMIIPSGFHVGMEGHSDVTIRFPPKRGLVGWVYRNTNASAYCYRTLDHQNKWIGGYELGPIEAKQVSPRLQWAIGWPIVAPDGKNYGVVCVDGLDTMVEAKALEDAMREFGGKATAVAAEFAQTKRRRLSVAMETD